MKPYERNTYFFIDTAKQLTADILQHTVEKDISRAISLFDGSYLVKIPMDAKIPSVLKGFTTYIQADMKIEKTKREKGRLQSDDDI